MTELIRLELLQIIEQIDNMNYAIKKYERLAATIPEEEKQLIFDIQKRIEKYQNECNKHNVPIASSSVK